MSRARVKNCKDPGNGNAAGCADQAYMVAPVTRYEHQYHRQRVQVVHPIEIVRKHHCIPVYEHSYVYYTKDEPATSPDQACVQSRNKKSTSRISSRNSIRKTGRTSSRTSSTKKKR
ncbi:hypothetical protein J7E73_13600 [Paenibacillus albidus]|uniref:hypothetical protein n=1 Tax=Paenibacillus albidus TaxID=2041023 RepID=UPI001BE93908|nr:hypothetical protein [Paenibacillus albidus]MBT2290158.1 hypothetical protein [Paenibacillus albidus]